MAIASPPTIEEQHVVLRDISWRTYECLLADNIDRSSPRLTYDNGLLVIVMPSLSHEEDNRTLAAIVEILCEEWEIPFRNLDGMTFKREDLGRGFEPDSCFYIQNIAAVPHNGAIDLAHDPPPDLIIEIDVTSVPVIRLAMYEQLRVPEVWRWKDGVVQILAGPEAGYTEKETSVAFPHLTAAQLNHFRDRSGELDRHLWLREVRKWARENGTASTDH